MLKRSLCLLCALVLVSLLLHAQQVSFERLLRTANEPQNWLTYSGGYESQRYSRLLKFLPKIGTIFHFCKNWILAPF